MITKFIMALNTLKSLITTREYWNCICFDFSMLAKIIIADIFAILSKDNLFIRLSKNNINFIDFIRFDFNLIFINLFNFKQLLVNSHCVN